MTELKIGRKAVRAIVKSKDADLLVVQFKPDAVPLPEEILGFFEKVGGIQQLHFFTPSYAKIGRPAYYIRDAEPPRTTYHRMGQNGPQDDTSSDVPEVDEEMRKSALRFLMPTRFVEAAREQASIITGTGAEIKWQGRKRKRDGAKEPESLASEFVADALNSKKERKRLKRQQKTGNVEAAQSVDHQVGLLGGPCAIDGEETGPETTQVKHSSYADTSPETKKLKKGERKSNPSVISDAVDSTVQTIGTLNPASQSNPVAEDSAPGDAEGGGTRKKEGKRKHKREPVQREIPQEEVNINSSELVPSDVADRTDGMITEPSAKEKERKKKSKKKGHDKLLQDVPHTTQLIPDFKPRAWSPSEPLEHQEPLLNSFQSERRGKLTCHLNRTVGESSNPGFDSRRSIHV